jgi:hypothetical protein
MNWDTIKKIILGLIIVISFMTFLFWLLFPQKLSLLIFTGFYLSFQKIIFSALIIILLLAALVAFVEEKFSLSIGVIFLTGIFAYLAAVGYNDLRLTNIAQSYKPQNIDQPIQMTSRSLLHTPRDVAETEISALISTSTYKPDDDTLDVTIDDQGDFDFVEAINPATIYSKYILKKGVGYAILHDHLEGKNRKNVIDTPIKIGEDLFWRNGVDNHLYRDRWFSTFTSVLPVPTSEGGNERVVLVANNVTYSPLFHVPQWLGAKVVDGEKVEFLSPQAAAQDPRLIGRPIFPREVAESIIEAQIFEKGLFGNFGRQDIVEFSKNHDGSHLQEIRDGNGRLYYFAPVQGRSTNSVIAFYYVDAQTGDLFKYVLPRLESHFGYKRAELAIKAGSTVRPWSDQYSIENLQYFTRIDGSMWVIGTITQTTYDSVLNKTIHTYVESVVVSDADDTVKQVFHGRSELINWADSENTLLVNSTPDLSTLYQELDEVRTKESEILDQIKTFQGV